MSEPLIHPRSRVLLDAYLSRPAHALLLDGETGVGLNTVAVFAAGRIGTRSMLQRVTPDDKGTIGIDTIRALYALTRTGHDAPRVIVIDDADAMGGEAQNALLKLLEEPGSGVYFILTSHRPNLLLPTIRSRTQRIMVQPLPADATAGLIPADLPPDVSRQLRFLAEGLPAELVRLQQDESYRARKIVHMKDAKTFVSGDMYERLILANRYAARRDEAVDFLTALARLLSFMILDRGQTDVGERAMSVEDVRNRLARNAHVKTQLMYLAGRF